MRAAAVGDPDGDGHDGFWLGFQMGGDSTPPPLRLYEGPLAGEVEPAVALASIQVGTDHDVRWNSSVSGLAQVGDVDGDGFDDLLASHPSCGATPHPAPGSGEARLLLGPFAGDRALEDGIAIEPEGPYGQLGEPVAGVCDLDGDGLADLAVGDGVDSWQRADVHVFLGPLGSGRGAADPQRARAEDRCGRRHVDLRPARTRADPAELRTGASDPGDARPHAHARAARPRAGSARAADPERARGAEAGGAAAGNETRR